MIGAMFASVIAAIGGVGDKVAHGGPIVAVLGGISNILWFFVAVIVGSLATMLTVLLFKRHTLATAKAVVEMILLLELTMYFLMTNLLITLHNPHIIWCSINHSLKLPRNQ